MNVFYVMCTRIQRCYRKNRLLFTLFIMGGILNTVLVAYCYGNLLPTVANRNAQKLQNRGYSVGFSNQYAAMDDIEALMESPLVESCILGSKSGFGTCLGDYPLNRLNGRLDFQNENEAIVPPMDDAALGDRISIGDRVFSVVGTAMGTQNLYIIPQAAFTELGLDQKINAIHMIAAPGEIAAVSSMVPFITSLFPYQTSIWGDAVALNAVEARESKVLMAAIAATALVAVIAQALLLQNLLKGMRDMDTISMILGATRWSVILQTAAETLLLCLIPSLLGVFIHISLYGLFDKLNIVSDISYTFRDYYMIVALLLSLSLLTMIPVVIKSVMSTPIQNRRNAMQ